MTEYNEDRAEYIRLLMWFESTDYIGLTTKEKMTLDLDKQAALMGNSIQKAQVRKYLEMARTAVKIKQRDFRSDGSLRQTIGWLKELDKRWYFPEREKRCTETKEMPLEPEKI